MEYKITCPYCFKEMMDDEVLFRSDLVNQGECDIIPEDYDDLDDFKARYRGSDKLDILRKYEDWSFFEETVDETYEAFWKPFGGTTEYNPADDILKVKAYHRRIIDPNNPDHQKYLKKQPDDTYLIRDDQNMVSQIELISGEHCHRRVCPHCHNPLPDNYGKNNVKFATVIGITGAGKTVYLSQLLKRMRPYATKVGLNAIVTNTGVRSFLENNTILAKKPLPGSTPSTRFQQPLFYEMVKNAGGDRRSTDTFVLYDVAGEVFKDVTLVDKFAPFVEHSDGVIVLIDPLQFEVISGASKDGKKLDEPTQVLEIIHDKVSHGQADVKCDIPFAICLSKADMEPVQEVLDDELKKKLLDDVKGVKDERGFNKTTFNAEEYAPIAEGLIDFIKSSEMTLAQMMDTNYSSYAYFAFTALGCDVETFEDENGNKFDAPVGPVLPKRVEEPILWLFYKMGYIDKNANLPGEITCPVCGAQNSYELPEDEQIIYKREGKLRLKKVAVHVNRCCKTCGHKWEYAEY